MFTFRLLSRGLLLILLFVWQYHAVAQEFPLPTSLKPNVEFWKRVYHEIDGDHGFMHDDRNLAIVYETIRVPKNSSRKKRRQIINQARERIKAQLKRIATRPYRSLTDEEKAIHGLFPENATGRDFRAAMRHVRFQRGQADKFEQAIRRSGYYMDYISKRLQDAGMPGQLAALPFVESSFNIIARSHVGAAGIWQFMPATGRRFMKVNHVIDERYDPYRATDAAISLLQYNYSILGSWPLALTAYNHGVGGMRRAVRKTGTKDIGVIVKQYRGRSFGFASRNFYSEFLAALSVYHNRERYFPGVQPYNAEKLVRFKLDHYIPASVVAKTLGVKLEKLKLHNLALREPVWEGDKHMPASYELRIPRHLLTGNIDAQLRQVPVASRHAKQVPDTTYRVRKGDSLSRIAAVYGVKVDDLVRMNNLRSRHRIRVGQTLYLPQRGQPLPPKPPARPVVVAAAEIAVKTDADKQPAVVSASAPTAQPKLEVVEEPLVEDEVVESVQQIEATDPAEYSVAADNTIEIQAAETLGHYADWLAVRASQLRRINRMSYRTPLVIGKRLKLDFSKVSPQEFEGKRLAYHKQLEDGFFATFRIDGRRSYSIRRGDSLWVIANREKDAPLWLIRQYNPDVDFSRLQPGDKITLPVIGKKI